VAALLFAVEFGLAQENNTNNANLLAGGIWHSCVTTRFSKQFACIDSKNKFEFFEDGTYSETRKTDSAGLVLISVTGTWSLSGNILTIDQNDKENHKSYPRIKKIKWLNNNLFYFWGREGKHGTKMYTYFQRAIN
jgi:hypothetical protein